MKEPSTAISSLESALNRGGWPWGWQMVLVKKQAGAAFDFSHYADRDKGVPTPCHEVPGAPLQIVVSTNAWKADGRDLAAFPDEVERLLEVCPAYPSAIVTLPAPPDRNLETPIWNSAPAAAVLAAAENMQAMSAWAGDVADWLRECSRLIVEAVGLVQGEGEDLRNTIAASRYQDWHINSLDALSGTVSVMGRQLKISPRGPVGTTEDLSTIHLAPLLGTLWKASYQPVVRLEAADYGTCRVKIAVGRRSGANRSHWIDLRAMEVVKAKRKRGATKKQP